MLDVLLPFVRSRAGIRCWVREVRNGRWGVLPMDGGLSVDPFQYDPGALLHEAAHLALMPLAVRKRIYGYCSPLWNFRDDETAAVAWSLAACRFLGIDDRHATPDGAVFVHGGRVVTIDEMIADGRRKLCCKGLTTSFPKIKRWNVQGCSR